MPAAQARIATSRADRYLSQLCGHLGQMRRMRHLPFGGHGGGGVPRVEHVEQTGNQAAVRFADGSWHLQADETALLISVQAEDPAALERLKDAITGRITKIGRRDALTITWH